MLKALIGRLLRGIEAVPHSSSSMLPVDEFRKPAPLDQPIAFSAPEATVGAIEYYKVDERRAYPATLNVEVALESGGKLSVCLPGVARRYTLAKEQPPTGTDEYFTIVNYT